MPHPLPLTGERTLPGVAGEEYWFSRHLAAYEWVARHCQRRLPGAVVVDAGSGEGYGADLLRAAGARTVIGLEYDRVVADNAARAYPGVATVVANLASLPLTTGSADVIVSLQVLEHLWDLPAFLRDCARVLRPGGAAVFTTPNRDVFSPGLGRGERPTNPFHVEEFDAAQLTGMLDRAGLSQVIVRGLHHGPRLAGWERSRGAGLVSAQVAMLTGLGTAPPDTARFVTTCTVEDFEVGDSEHGQDLIATAVRA